MELQEVLFEIETELGMAIKKFPNWPTDGLHAVAIIGEESGELTKSVLQLTYEPHKTSISEVEREAIQTAAMAVRFLMTLDDLSFSPGAMSPTQPPPHSK